MNKCLKCQETGCLVLSTTNADYICEACGEWQDVTLNDVWETVA